MRLHPVDSPVFSTFPYIKTLETMATSTTNELLHALQRLEQNNQQFQNAMREKVRLNKEVSNS